MDLLIKLNFAIVALLLIFISWRDITTRMISHSSLLMLAAAMLSLFILEKNLPNIFATFLIFLACFMLFTLHIIGGGDVKLLTLMSLSFPNSSLALFLLTTAICGGFIAVIGLLFFYQNVRIHGVPYGVAIAIAFISVYPTTSALY